jgi:hypothetical protein
MPRLATLRLHEVCDPSTIATLVAWPGLPRLESLELTDDYHGRLVAHRLNPSRLPDRLRSLRGVILVTEEDVDAFLTRYRLNRVTQLQLSFCAQDMRSALHPTSEGYISWMSSESADRVLRSGDLVHLTELTIGFHYMPDLQAHVVQTLADPSVLPQLRRLSFYGSFGNEQPALDGLRSRFGPRLHAW